MKPVITIALSGNPNSGKTTIFNALTGARQHVGNYPGVTVERKEGSRRHNGMDLKIIDLPGTYSLTAYSSEELVARNFIVHDKPDVVVDVLDSSNLERNLYLVVQLMELGAPMVLAFNMSDMAMARGYEFNLEKLSQALGARIIQTIGSKGAGMNGLLDAIIATAEDHSHCDSRPRPRINYGRHMEEEISKLGELIGRHEPSVDKKDLRWLAIKLLENDKEIMAGIASGEVLEQALESAARVESVLGEHPETAIAGKRYAFISDVCQESIRSTMEIRRTLSSRIDAIATNRVLGIPIFLGLMYLVFQLTFTLGGPPMGWIEELTGWLGGVVAAWWPEDSESPLKSLLVDGVIGGVGGVIIFLPNILLLFLAIAILEDTGYMARVAFIMDRVMNMIGLHGKSFIPMLIGFGCSVPAIMATRTLENRRDRLTTMLVAPLMSCGARLPIYALIIPAFFPEAWHAPLLWVIYVIGVLLAILAAKLLRITVLKGESAPFVMELPPYRVPALRGVMIHMWERGWLYLKKAGTIILGISILLWAMTTYPSLPGAESARFAAARERIEASVLDDAAKEAELSSVGDSESEAALAYSVAGRLGHIMEPLLKPMGFDWRIGTALIGAFAAKEVFVAQLGIVFSVGEADEESESLREKMRGAYSPLTAFCIMLFCLISAPCMATIAVTKRESNSWKWASFQLGGLTLLAYVITVIVYQMGDLLGLGLN